MEFHIVTLIYLASCLAVAGFAKGVTGIGLPVIAVPFMALAIDLRLAVALMPVSIIGSNIVNAMAIFKNPSGLRRFWSIAVALPIGTAGGAYLLGTTDTNILKIVVGAVVITFVAFQVARPGWRLSEGAAKVIAPLAGITAGLLGGITTIFAPPLVMFLMAAGFNKEEFVAAVSIFYIIGICVLSAFLVSFNLMDLQILTWSGAAFIPVLGGQLAGSHARKKISESFFRNLVFCILTVAGLTMIISALI